MTDELFDRARYEILQAILTLQGDTSNYIPASEIASQTGLDIEEVNGHLESLATEDSLQLVKTSSGHKAYLNDSHMVKLKEHGKPNAGEQNGVAVDVGRQLGLLHAMYTEFLRLYDKYRPKPHTRLAYWIVLAGLSLTVGPSLWERFGPWIHFFLQEVTGNKIPEIETNDNAIYLVVGVVLVIIGAVYHVIVSRSGDSTSQHDGVQQKLTIPSANSLCIVTALIFTCLQVVSLFFAWSGYGGSLFWSSPIEIAAVLCVTTWAFSLLPIWSTVQKSVDGMQIWLGITIPIVSLLLLVTHLGIVQGRRERPEISDDLRPRFYNSWADPNLPEKTFGSINDRQWMETAEAGARSQLGIQPNNDFVAVWALTDEISKTDRFTAYLYPGTGNLIYVQAYEGSIGGFRPLRRLGDGPGVEYRFDVPERSHSSRLLVLIALSKETYDSIESDPKFTLMSKPR